MNYSKLLFVLFTSLLLNLGCSKTSKPETEHTILNNLKNKHITETPMTGVEAGIHFLSEFQSECDFRPELACGSILHFNSWQEYYDCYNCLDHEFNDWCDNFENHFSNLNEDDYNNLIETSDWSEDVPLMAYENTIDGFFSLRKKISLQMNTWEEVEPQDLNNCPEDFAFHDDIQRTLLNSEGNIAIGDRIYHYSSSGEILELPFDCDCVQQLLKTHTTPDCARVKRGTPGPPSCNGDYYLPQTSNYEFDDHTYRHDYYIQWHGGWEEGETDSRVEAGLIVYKKKHNNYKRHRCKKFVRTYGNDYMNDNGNCIQRDAPDFSPGLTARRRKIIVKQSWPWADYGVRYWHTNEFHGDFSSHEDGYENALEGVQ